jgi:hypothetical protein
LTEEVRIVLTAIEVTAGANSPIDLARVFDLLSDPAPVRRVFTADPMGRDCWCQVIGWSTLGPSPALAALAEDSGDGVILLVYGGDAGIRLKSVDSQEDWDLSSPNQWGEPCLMLDKDTLVE